MAVTKRIEVDSITEANKITILPQAEVISFNYVNDVEGKKGQMTLTKEQMLEVISEADFNSMVANLLLLADSANPDKEEDEAL
jgi:hypothetical protein